MKICIPVENYSGMNSKVYGHFGSAPSFAVFETENGSISELKNTNEYHVHGACTPAGLLLENGIGAAVCSGMGMRALALLRQAGIKVYYAEGRTVADIIENMKSIELKEFTDENSCSQHERCGK